MIIRTQGSQKEASIIEITKKVNPVLHYDLEYDTTHPEETIRTFVADIKEMIAKYEWNKERIREVEAELCDLEHYIEIASFKNVPEGYRLYRKIAELRRERRACKSEIDLLQPIYEYFHATEVLNKLSAVQGNVAKSKYSVDGRCYLVRTEVLDPYLEQKQEAPKPEEEPQEEVAVCETEAI